VVPAPAQQVWGPEFKPQPPKPNQQYLDIKENGNNIPKLNRMEQKWCLHDERGILLQKQLHTWRNSKEKSRARKEITKIRAEIRETRKPYELIQILLTLFQKIRANTYKLNLHCQKGNTGQYLQEIHTQKPAKGQETEFNSTLNTLYTIFKWICPMKQRWFNRCNQQMRYTTPTIWRINVMIILGPEKAIETFNVLQW
jgi:hypothetical protein